LIAKHSSTLPTITCPSKINGAPSTPAKKV
jgi:hypothetical protein